MWLTNTEEKAVVPSLTSAVYLEGDGSISFENVSVAFDEGAWQPYWLPPARVAAASARGGSRLTSRA